MAGVNTTQISTDVQPTAPAPASSGTAVPTQLSTSSSAHVPQNSCTAEVLSVFECPVCLDYMLPPYLQCQSGHLVCGNCRPKLTCCPTCRGPVPSVRNLVMEKIANSVLFPCKFSSNGCPAAMLYQEKVEHEEACEFRPYSCPCPGASCKWQGNLDAVMPHLVKIHKSITTLQGISLGEDIVFLATDINLPGSVDWVMMQSCFGYHFMLVLEKQEKCDGHQMFYAVVQLIGSRQHAENFLYRLELSSVRRRLCWEATPRSIHEGVANAISQSDCLAFDTNTAQLFADSGNLDQNNQCILACHYKPNFGNNPDYADLTASQIPVESCTHLIYESAFVNQFWDVVARHPSEKLYTSGNRSYAWINRLKTKFKSLTTLLAIDISFDVEFYDSLSVRHFRSKLSHSIYRAIEEYAFNGFLLNLPEMHQARHFSLRKKMIIAVSIKRSVAQQIPKIIADVSKYVDFVIIASDEMIDTNISYFVDPLHTSGIPDRENALAKFQEPVVNKLLSAGMMRSKIVVGLSLKVHSFVFLNPNENIVGASVIRNSPDFFNYRHICKVSDADMHEQAYSKYKKSNDRWIAFNDEETIREKVAWVQHKNLGGIALTDVNFDDPTGYCSKSFYTFPLVKMAHSQMGCLHVHAVLSSADDKETKNSQNGDLYEQCVRLCTYTLRNGNDPFEIDNLIKSGCTHLSIYVGKFDSPGNIVYPHLLLNNMELLKIKRANFSAVLLSVHCLDFWKFSSNDTSNNINLFIENIEHIMNEFGFDGVHLHFEFANVIEEYEKLYAEKLYNKILNIRQMASNRNKTLFIISLNVNAFINEAEQWLRRADYLNLLLKYYEAESEEFLHLIHRTGNRKKLLIGGALFKHQWSTHSDFCKQLYMSIPEYEDNLLDLIYDNIETIVRKARFATMYGFGGMALLNVHMDDSSGICLQGSKFPCLRAMKENYLCQPRCETLENHCQKSSKKVICYYSTEMDSDAVFSSDLPLKRCTHLAVNILYFFKDRNGELKIHTSWSTMRVLNELLSLRIQHGLKLVAVVQKKHGIHSYNEIIRLMTQDERWFAEFVRVIELFDFDAVELHFGSIGNIQHQHTLNILKKLKSELKRNPTASNQCPVEFGFAAEMYPIDLGNKHFVETIYGLFDYITLLSFKSNRGLGIAETNRRIAIEDTIRMFEDQGFPVRKLVLALSSFGIQFNLGCSSNVSVEDVLSNLRDHAQYLEYDRKYRMNELCHKVIRKKMKEFISYRHMGAVAYSCNEILFYERPETIRYKARFAAARGLSGIALYRLNDENDCSSCSGIPYCLLDAATADC
ncbi:E3 ubiquitin-protein ligase Siah1 [Trichinella britovi]|uniref:E3 ubiquitin-protein ligase n=1 Tax=Trichinella britovi TaxID=45882 RepID=A0A0V1CXN0_TRIBR|nr:E3 ubiquitin-protein ligase Siah1 [Trichinella britovi]